MPVFRVICLVLTWVPHNRRVQGQTKSLYYFTLVITGMKSTVDTLSKNNCILLHIINSNFACFKVMGVCS